MDVIYTFLLGLNIVILFAFAALIYLRKPRNVFHQVFSFGLFCTVIWMFSHFARYAALPVRLAVTREELLFWGKMSHFFSAFEVAFLSYFLFLFPDRQHRPLPAWFSIFWLLILPFFIAGITLSDLVVRDLHHLGDKYFVVPGPLMPLFLLYAAGSMFAGIAIIVNKMRNLVGVQRMQVKYVAIGLMLSTIFLAGINLLGPVLTMIFPKLLQFSGVYRFTPFFSLFLIYCAAYSILKHRLLDLELVISRTTAYAAAMLIVIMTYVGIVVFAEKFLRNFLMSGSNYLFSAGSALLVAFIFYPLQTTIQVFIYNRFFASRFEYQKFLLEASRTIVTILNLEELINYFIEIVHKNIGTQRAAFLLRNEEEEPGGGHTYYIRAFKGIDPQVASRFEVKNGLISWFSSTRQVFVRDEAELEMVQQGFSKLYGKLSMIGAELMVPVFTKNNLAGILAIDRKINGRIYSQADIDTLNILAAGVGVAIENARLYGEAITDSLTGLFNRRYFDYRLQEEVMRAHRYGRALSLLMIDIDHFKEINDRYGHPAGDFVLRKLGQIIRSSLRHIDIVCRYGGEEIIVILPETGEKSVFTEGNEVKTVDACLTVAERIRKLSAEQEFAFAEDKIKLTLSIGMVYYSDMAQQLVSPGDIVSLVDQALYRAKDAGRNCVRGMV